MLFRIQRHSFSNLWENPKVGLVLTTGRATLEKHKEQLSRGRKISLSQISTFSTGILMPPSLGAHTSCCCCAEFPPREHRAFFGCCTYRKLHLSRDFLGTDIKKIPHCCCHWNTAFHFPTGFLPVSPHSSLGQRLSFQGFALSLQVQGMVRKAAGIQTAFPVPVQISGSCPNVPAWGTGVCQKTPPAAGRVTKKNIH